MFLADKIGELDDFLCLFKEGMATAVKPAELKTLQKKEMDLWHTWHEGGRKAKDLSPLYESYKPLIQKTANKFTNRAPLPVSAIHSELRKQFVSAVKSYDPKRGTQLNSWVTTHLQKVSRFIKTYQNYGKIPEGNIAKITEFHRAKTELADRLGHEPDTKALADHLKWSPKRVIQMGKELRKDESVSGYPNGDPAVQMTSKEIEAVQMLHYDSRLGADERAVYEYVFGVNGKPKLGPGDIAKKTNIHPSKVSRIRTKLKNYLQEAMEVL